MSGPYKICNETAKFIRDTVAPFLILKEKVPSYAVEEIKKHAREDHIDHQAYDPEYNLGGGPANMKSAERVG